MDETKIPRCTKCGTAEGIRMRKRRGVLCPRSRCNRCELEASREHESRPEVIAMRDAYRRTTARKESARRYYTSPKGLANYRKYRSEHPLQAAARGAVNHAVRDGRLEKQPCAQCGATGRVQGHHHMGYEREYWLDVVWLCRGCHDEEHRSAAE